jgi:hypothetical protein
MIEVRRRSKWLIALSVPLGLVLWDRCGSGLGLSAEGILAVSPGMTMEEVRSILGEPLEVEVRSGFDFFCRCNEERVCKEPERTTWTFTRKPVMRALPFPMLWVHFNSRGHVHEVYAKRYSALGMDSEGIYMKKLSPCDTTDRTIERYGGLDDDTNALRRLQEVF